MVHDDDDARERVGPEDLLAPPGPRRSSYTPPSRDAESLQAAANVFNDDAIAEAMAAELAKIASGPIPIVPVAYRVPAPELPSSPAPAPQVQVPSTPAPLDAASRDLSAAPPPSGPPVQPASSVPVSPAPRAAPAPPPPYLGAPAPTVPAADAPPPPGYESLVQAGSQPPPSGSEQVSPFAPRPEPEEQRASDAVPADDEPSLEGTAFAGFHFSDFRFAPPTVPASAPESEEPQVPFPGVQTPTPEPSSPVVQPPADLPPVPTAHSMFAPPPLVEPPAPDPTYPVFSDQIGVVPSFGEVASSEAGAERAGRDPAVPPVPQTASPAEFESLLAGAGQATGSPSEEWSAPPPSLFTEPAVGAAKGAPIPFGEGVARDSVVDPIEGVFGTTLGSAPSSELTESDVLQVSTPSGEPSFEVVPAPAAAADTILATKPSAFERQRIFRAEISGEEPTPLDARVGRAARLFWLWFASNSSLVAVVFGGIIFSLGMSLRQTMVATLAGVALSFIPLGLGTLAGKRSGQPTMVVSRATFGVVGNVVPAVLGLLSRLFWGAGLLWLLGAGVADIVSGAKLGDGFTQRQLTFIVMVIAFAIVLVCAYFGYALIARIQLVISIASALLLIGFVGITAHYLDFSTALKTGDGPWVLVITGAVLVFSFVGLAWANSGSDLARYQRPGSSGGVSMLWATFGAAVPSFLLIVYGALLCASNREIARGILADPLDQLGRLLPAWYPAPLIIVTALGLASGAIIAIYSGGFALQAAGLRAARKYNVIVVGALVLVIALLLTLTVSDFTQLLRDFATTVAVPVAAWAGIFAAEIMIRNRRFDSRSLLRRGGVYADVRWGNLIALVVITAIGLGFTSATVGWLSWEGYLFSAFGVPPKGQLASTDLGVVVALVVGLLFPIAAGIPAIRRQESATRTAE